MKTKFKTSSEDKIEPKGIVYKLKKEYSDKIQQNKEKIDLIKNNKNFRNNQNYIMSDSRYKKAYRFFSNYWLFSKYLHIEKIYNIKDYNQGLYGLIGIMILFSYMLVNSLYSFIIYNIILFIIGILFFSLNKYLSKNNRKNIEIYSNLREIIFINNDYEKYRELERKARNENTGFSGYDFD